MNLNCICKTLIFILLLATCISIFSQDKKEPLALNFSYFKESLIHSGIKLGVEYPLWSKENLKQKKNKAELKKRQNLLVATNIAAYYHKNYNTGVIINAEAIYRIIRNKGFKFEVIPGLGYFRTFLNDQVFSVTGDNKVKRERFVGQDSFMPSISFGLGKDFSFNDNRPFAGHVKPSFYFQIPYNHTFLPHVVLEIGVTYKLFND